MSGWIAAAVLIALLSLGAFAGDRYMEHERRLREPVMVEGTLIGSDCGFAVTSGRRRPSLDLKYSYQARLSDGRTAEYSAVKWKSFGTEQECAQAAVVAKESGLKRQVWYEKEEPWKAKFSLEPADPFLFLWGLLPAAIFALVGILTQRGKRSGRRNKDSKMKRNFKK
jgi:hypothetical protein